MAAAQMSAQRTVPELMTTVMQLTPVELREFQRRFAEWQLQNQGQASDEAALVQACTARMAAADERRLKKLVTKSERGTLRPKELEDYRALVRRSETVEATRLAALTELARRWDKPVRMVMETIGWEGGADETASHPARPAKAGPRSRR
jgi:hypothetical protein